MFDLGSGLGSLQKGVARIKCPTLVSNIVYIVYIMLLYLVWLSIGVRCVL